MDNPNPAPRSIINGIKTTRLGDWIDFTDFITDRLDYRGYIWRGQQNESWLLEPTLERALKGKNSKQITSIREEHLKRFKYASRGRRGATPPNYSEENMWWALGQHNGLATPLLDWTRSPYVAAYFAFYREAPNQEEGRAIFGLAERTVTELSKSILKTNTENAPSIIECFHPHSDDNPRLVSQGGSFTRSPDGIDIETWVDANFKNHRKVVLHKLILPNSERETALKSLNRMNINHLTLFPDLYGASIFTNLDLTIEKY